MNKHAVESSIRELVADFKSCPVNFIREEDFRSKLFALLDRRKSLKSIVPHNGEKLKISAIHCNWFGPKARHKSEVEGFVDVAILTAKSVQKKPKYHGESHCMQGADLECHSCIEIKKWSGALYYPLRKSKEIKDLHDIRTALSKRRTKYGYCLVFIDEDVTSQNKDKFKIIESYKKEIDGVSNLMVYLVPRNKPAVRLP